MDIIKKGQRFLCIRTVVMQPTGQIEYLQGKFYESEQDGCITDESGTKNHMWNSTIGKLCQYFVRAERVICDTYGVTLCVGSSVIVWSGALVKGKVVSIDSAGISPSVEVKLRWPHGNEEVGTFIKYHTQDGKDCMSDIVVR